MEPHVNELRVIKLGGSLLDLPDIVPSLRRWLESNPFPKNLMVVGGGELVESIRALDTIHHFDASFVHWLCVGLLRQTAQIASKLFPEFGLISTAHELNDFLDSSASSEISIVQVNTFYRHDRPRAELREDWDTTTDSISALLAREQSAQELVLLKSTSPPALNLSLDQWAKAGIVDACFPRVASKIPRVRICNLRES